MVEIVGNTGYDYAWLDAEHGSFSLSDLRQLIRAADAVGIDSIVRVPDHNPSFIQRVLDLGATGIVVPHIRTAADARAIVEAATYSPSGERGACPAVRSVGYLTQDWRGDSATADREVLIIGLIEDVEGVENVEEIAATPRLDGLVYGPFDLGMARGLAGDVTHPQLRIDHDRVVDACKANGIEYMTASVGWEGDSFEKTGSRIVTVLGDLFFIHDAFAKSLAAHVAKYPR
jgi:4-hydroxy-2-oxoheptanedioate aldolase